MAKRLGLWRPAVYGVSARNWFLVRDSEFLGKRYYFGASGRMVRYSCFETADRAARRLNAPTV